MLSVVGSLVVVLSGKDSDVVVFSVPFLVVVLSVEGSGSVVDSCVDS